MAVTGGIASVVAYFRRAASWRDIGLRWTAQISGRAQMLRNRRRLHNNRRRTGAALTELAICLPLLSIVTLGAIEAANGLYVRQKLVAISYDLARTATAQSKQAISLPERANELFRAYGVRNASFSVNPADPRRADPGTPVTVTVSAPMSSNSIGLTRLYGNIRSSTSLTMTKN
jgi:hypothetical protein